MKLCVLISILDREIRWVHWVRNEVRRWCKSSCRWWSQYNLIERNPPPGGVSVWVVSKWRTRGRGPPWKGLSFSRSNCEVRVVDCVLWDYVNRLVVLTSLERAHTNAQENGRANHVTNTSCPAHAWVMSQRYMDGSFVTDIKQHCHTHI